PRLVFPVLPDQSSPLDQRDAHRAEIIGADVHDFGEWHLAEWWLRFAFDNKGGLIAIVAERKSRGHSGHLHARKRRDPLQHFLKEACALLLLTVLRCRQRQLEGEETFALESRINVLKAIKALQHQSG